jgi:ArsR family metal-binding transcriptional regulator
MVYETKKCSFRTDEINVALFDNREEAAAFIDRLIAIANDVWARRLQIEPNFKQRELPRAMEIFKLLPRTNCRECGYPTCMAFATQLRENPGDALKCTPLTQENSLKLMELLGGL